MSGEDSICGRAVLMCLFLIYSLFEGEKNDNTNVGSRSLPSTHEPSCEALICTGVTGNQSLLKLAKLTSIAPHYIGPRRGHIKENQHFLYILFLFFFSFVFCSLYL